MNAFPPRLEPIPDHEPGLHFRNGPQTPTKTANPHNSCVSAWKKDYRSQTHMHATATASFLEQEQQYNSIYITDTNKQDATSGTQINKEFTNKKDTKNHKMQRNANKIFYENRKTTQCENQHDGQTMDGKSVLWAQRAASQGPPREQPLVSQEGHALSHDARAELR